MMPPEQVILFIIGTVVILFGAYFVTYYVGMKASGQTRAGLRNRNINLIDRYAIARDKQFCVIEVAGKVYIVGITNHAIALLDTLDAETYAKLTENNAEATPWHMTPVGQYGNRLTRKVVNFIAGKLGKADNSLQQSGTSGEADFSSALEEAQRAAGDKDDAAAKLPEDKSSEEMSTEIKIFDDRPESPENPEGD